MGKEYIVPNALTCLTNTNSHLLFNKNYSKLDTLFNYNTMLIEIYLKLIKKIVKRYQQDNWWTKILE